MTSRRKRANAFKNLGCGAKRFTGAVVFAAITAFFLYFAFGSIVGVTKNMRDRLGENIIEADGVVEAIFSRTYAIGKGSPFFDDDTIAAIDEILEEYRAFDREEVRLTVDGKSGVNAFSVKISVPCTDRSHVARAVLSLEKNLTETVRICEAPKNYPADLRGRVQISIAAEYRAARANALPYQVVLGICAGFLAIVCLWVLGSYFLSAMYENRRRLVILFCHGMRPSIPLAVSQMQAFLGVSIGCAVGAAGYRCSAPLMRALCVIVSDGYAATPYYVFPPWLGAAVWAIGAAALSLFVAIAFMRVFGDGAVAETLREDA